MSQRYMRSTFHTNSLRIVWAGIGFILLFLAQTFAQSFDIDQVKNRNNRKPDNEKIHLVHADRLESDPYKYPNAVGAQILNGNVVLTHSGMRLKCDSAVLYQGSNSFMAVGNVLLTQGDTVSLKGDSLYYDGTSQLARVYNKVEMRHHTMTLYTDLLNYDRISGRGYYDNGGMLIDHGSKLTSDCGDYFTATRKAEFRYRVELTNTKKDTLRSDTLFYDTQTKWALTRGPSNIYSGDSRIYTTNGLYNSESGLTKLYERSQVFNQGRRLIGDSIKYDKESGKAEAFMNVEILDPKNKSILQGDYGYYIDSLGESMATGRALAKDFSNEADTLFVHADTLRLFSYNLKTDSAYRMMHGYFHARAFRSDVQAVSDSIVFDSRTKLITLYKDPIVWSDNRQVLGEEIKVFCKDSTVDSIYVQRQALVVEQVDSNRFNQIGGKEMRAYYDSGKLRECHVDGNVLCINYIQEKDSSYLHQNYLETAKMRVYIKDDKLHRIWAGAESSGKVYPIDTAPPQHTRLSNFAWFDYIRPISKDDLFEWRGKSDNSRLKEVPRRKAPLQTISQPQVSEPSPDIQATEEKASEEPS